MLNKKTYTSITKLILFSLILGACTESKDIKTNNENSIPKAQVETTAVDVNKIFFVCKAHE